MGISRGYVSEPCGHHRAHYSRSPKADVLIDSNGHACLSDFGLISIAAGQSIDTSSWTAGGTTQWMSPELLDPGSFGLMEGRSTKESDCYALGMVIYEVLSGQTPFTPLKSFRVIGKVLAGQRPERPEGKGGALFTDGIWRTLELCWKHQPEERISAEVVLLCLEGTPPLPLQPDVDGIAGSNPDGQPGATLRNSSMFSLFRRSS